MKQEISFKRGRPCTVNEEVVKKLELAFSMDCTDQEACLMANISMDALYRYERKNLDFRNRKQLLKNKPFLIARTTIIRELQNDPYLAFKYMERKKKDEFGLPDRNEVPQTPIQINNYLGEDMQRIEELKKLSEQTGFQLKGLNEGSIEE